MQKQLAMAAFIGAACASQQTEVDNKQLEEIVGGVLKGALAAEGFDDINSCIKDAELVFGDAKTAIADFKKKDVSDVIAGIKKIAEMMQTIEQGMSDCSHLKADWAKLAKMSAIFSNPETFAYHVGKDLLVNGVEIYGEISTAVEDYEKAQWGDFGYNVGKAAAKTLIGTEQNTDLASSNDKMKDAEIMQGVLSAFGGKFDLYALLMCIYEEDQAALMFDVAVQSFEEAIAKKDPAEAIGGVIAVVAGVQQAKQGLPACEAIDSKSFDYKQIDQCIDFATHPSKHFEVIEKDLLMNGKAVMDDIKIGVAAYRAGDYFTFGQKMGKILELATEPIEEKPVKKVPALEIVKSTPAAVNRQMVAEFAQGFLETSQVGDFNFTNLLICIYEADQSALILYQAVEILEEAYEKKDLDDLIGGVIATIAFVQQLKQSIPVCEAVDTTKADWTHFDHIVDTLEDPEDHMAVIEKDIIMNGVTITEDIGIALEAFRAGDFLLFGRQLGKTMYIATEGNPADNLFLY